MEPFSVRASEGVIDCELECSRGGMAMIEGQCNFAPKFVFLHFGFGGFLP